MPHKLLVASGKGGVGTSIVASLAALAAAHREQRVLLVDATEGGGSLHHLFGLRPANSLWMLSDSRWRADDMLMEAGDGLTLVAGGTSGGAVTPVDDDQRRKALERLSALYENYDTVIFDGGSRLDTISAVAESVRPSLLLVTSADRLALAANYALVKFVRAQHANATISVVANRHGDMLAEEACEFLVGACSHFLGRSIDVVGAIPDDPCLQAAVGAGMTVRDALEGSPAAATMRDVLSRVVPTRSFTPPQAALTVPSPFSRRWS
jgi:flagellar biosynthesis protein FlhG